MKSSRLRMPHGGAARLFSVPHVYGWTWGVFLAANQKFAHPDALRVPGRVSATLTHDAGISWPDWRGERLAVEMLAIGGTVCLAFHGLADAIRCKKRLEGGGS